MAASVVSSSVLCCHGRLRLDPHAAARRRLAHGCSRRRRGRSAPMLSIVSSAASTTVTPAGRRIASSRVSARFPAKRRTRFSAGVASCSGYAASSSVRFRRASSSPAAPASAASRVSFGELDLFERVGVVHRRTADERIELGHERALVRLRALDELAARGGEQPVHVAGDRIALLTQRTCERHAVLDVAATVRRRAERPGDNAVVDLERDAVHAARRVRLEHEIELHLRWKRLRERVDEPLQLLGQPAAVRDDACARVEGSPPGRPRRWACRSRPRPARRSSHRRRRGPRCRPAGRWGSSGRRPTRRSQG